jgi:hypothetical protein
VQIRDSIEALVAAFNRGSLDVPDGFFTPRTAFSLNNRSYETILGGSPDDPLIRLLTRGAGGYRTAAKVVQYALQQPIVNVRSLSDCDDNGTCLATLRIEGRLRDSDEPFVGTCLVRLTYAGDQLADADVSWSPEDLARIAAARR